MKSGRVNDITPIYKLRIDTKKYENNNFALNIKKVSYLGFSEKQELAAHISRSTTAAPATEAGAEATQEEVKM